MLDEVVLFVIGTSVDVVIVTAFGTVEAVEPTRSDTQFCLGHHSSY